ncbi:hypothetical protein KM043_001209 [Ampulex compressa]|nr:hypothetical protein KM043_001209 [Ampulex compressa]
MTSSRFERENCTLEENNGGKISEWPVTDRPEIVVAPDDNGRAVNAALLFGTLWAIVCQVSRKEREKPFDPHFNQNPPPILQPSNAPQYHKHHKPHNHTITSKKQQIAREKTHPEKCGKPTKTHPHPKIIYKVYKAQDHIQSFQKSSTPINLLLRPKGHAYARRKKEKA